LAINVRPQLLMIHEMDLLTNQNMYMFYMKLFSFVYCIMFFRFLKLLAM